MDIGLNTAALDQSAKTDWSNQWILAGI